MQLQRRCSLNLDLELSPDRLRGWAPLNVPEFLARKQDSEGHSIFKFPPNTTLISCAVKQSYFYVNNAK